MTQRFARRLLLAASAALLATSVVAAGPVAASDELSIPQAEAAALKLLNLDRARAGLVAVRLDSRLSAIARARSEDMATRDYFSHRQPDGRNVFDLIGAAPISWYNAGEIIAWNNYPTFETSAASANHGWLNSPTHKSVIVWSGYNYAGVGLAVQPSTGKKYWTAIFMRGPDRTGGWATMRSPSIGSIASGGRSVRIRWSGGDLRLSALTAGLREFQVQRRVNGGAWSLVLTTTATYMTRTLTVGRTYEFRVRAIDRRGNRGAWTKVMTVRP